MSNFINIPIQIRPDEKGYYDRQCPNEQCEYVFKINMDDWENKIRPKNEVHCPMCGYTTDSEQWYTYEQIKAIRENARSYAINMAYEMLDKSLSKLAKSTHNNKYIKITYKPNKKITYKNNPIGQRDEWNLDITCEKCGTRYSVIGSAYFCPCCGHNSVEKVFEDSILRIEKMIKSQKIIKKQFTENFGIDNANDMCRSMLESSIGDIVSAFQKFAKENLVSHSQKDTSKIVVNDFQIVEKGSVLYKKHFGKAYEDFLNPSELNLMNLLFQKRHILEHNEGLVDEKYLQKSKDKTYSIGQRIVIKEDDTKELLKIIKKLTKSLKNIANSKQGQE